MAAPSEPSGVDATGEAEPDPVEVEIIEAALAEMDEHGIVGFRVAEVAERADTTVSMIYRRFADRDGLLAATLDTWYRRNVEDVLSVARSLLDAPGEITIDDVVRVTVARRSPEFENFRHRTQRVFVAAMENDVLRLAVQGALTRGFDDFEAITARILDRMPPDQRFDPLVLTELILKRNALMDDLLGPRALSDDEYSAFLRRLLAASVGSLPATRADRDAPAVNR